MKTGGLKFILFMVGMIWLTSNIFAQTVENEKVRYKAKSYGVPASPEIAKVIQPNGETINLYLKGDGAVHWYETIDGYTVLKDQDGAYVYAVQDDNKNLIKSDILVSSAKNLVNIEKGLKFSNEQIISKRSNYNADPFKSDITSKAFPTTGERKVLLLLIDFPDKEFVRSNSDFNNLMNQANYNGTGSFKDYYYESSYGQLTVTTTVVGWFTAIHEMAYYGANDEDGYDVKPRELVKEAVDFAEDQGIDFSEFDNDGDGEVDGVQVIHAGYGEENSGVTEDAIWSHQWSLYNLARTYDGVLIDGYAMYPELRGSSGSNITNIGVVCHEFGHSLGLPDYYDTDYEGSGGDSFDLGNWDMMAGGSWNANGAIPANHNVLSKWDLGWLEPIVLDKDTVIENMPNIYENDTAFVIYSQVEDEYFILENRQQIGFDTYVPGHGLLIYHVDKNHSGWYNNTLNTDPTHQAMDIEEADNAQGYDSYAGDPFPGTSNKTEFTDGTSPSILAWDNSSTGVGLINISENTDLKTISLEVTTEDVKKPDVIITAEETDLTNEHPIIITITFDEPVTGFEISDLYTLNAVASNLTAISETVYEAEIEPIKEGYVYAKVLANVVVDAVGNYNNASPLWKLRFLYATGMNDIEEDLISIFPNPATDKVYINIPDLESESYTVKLIDITGRELLVKQLSRDNNDLDISNQKDGIYIINIQLNNKQFNKRIIIK